jgi:hypothetical protein
MSDHYVVALDQGHLRIYAERRDPNQRQPSLELAESMDFPDGKRPYFAHDTSPQGRFPGTGENGGARHPGMSIDERLPMKAEAKTRNEKLLAEEVEKFLGAHPVASWDFAAPPAIHRAVLDRISSGTRLRLRRELGKDLVKHAPADLVAAFAEGEREQAAGKPR